MKYTQSLWNTKKGSKKHQAISCFFCFFEREHRKYYGNIEMLVWFGTPCKRSPSLPIHYLLCRTEKFLLTLTKESARLHCTRPLHVQAIKCIIVLDHVQPECSVVWKVYTGPRAWLRLSANCFAPIHSPGGVTPAFRENSGFQRFPLGRMTGTACIKKIQQVFGFCGNLPKIFVFVSLSKVDGFTLLVAS